MNDSLISQMMTAITLLSYVAACARLLTYRRGFSHYKRTMALVAWSLIVFTGTSALEMIFYPTRIYLGTAGIALTLSILIWRARGNVALLIRDFS